MVNVALGSSTSDFAEMTIDYTKKKKEFHGLPKDTLKNRISASFFDWFKMLSPYYVGIVIICALWWVVFNAMEFEIIKWFMGFLVQITILIAILTISGLPLLSLDKKVDKKIKLMFAEQTIKGHQVNKIVYKEMDTNILRIPDFNNVMLKYDATGDFEKHLDKILIRKQKKDDYLRMQGTAKEMFLSDVYKGYTENWNAYFIFKKIPKKGRLEIEFI